jgi:hypothetical protein
MESMVSSWSFRLAFLLLAGVAARAGAQEWARDMFSHTSHNFATVARGAKVEHRFTVENIYVEDAHIASVRASCGCTTPEVVKPYLKTWEKAEIVAKVNTAGQHHGQKDVTITVKFDRPYPGEVQLQIHCFIRADVVVQPGVVQFGTVTQGTAARQRVAITYAGNPNWQIQRVESSNAHLTPQVVQTSRVGINVGYDLYVDLAKTAPTGNYREQVFLITNDANPRNARIPIPVEGSVQAGITVHPEKLFMGTVEPGKTISRPLIVRGIAPFRILRAESSDARFRATVPQESATLHRVPVEFQAGAEPGKANSVMRLHIDNGAALEAAVDVQVVPPLGAPAPVTVPAAEPPEKTPLPEPAVKSPADKSTRPAKRAPDIPSPREL